MAYLKTKPYAVDCDEGQSLHFLGAQICVKATSEQTGGGFNLFDVSCPPGFATPLHIHYYEDVVVFVLEGKLSFFWGDQKMASVPGSYFYQPRGTPHGFRVEGGSPARILYLTFPAGFDRFVFDQKLASSKSHTELAAARYKIEILGPLSE